MNVYCSLICILPLLYDATTLGTNTVTVHPRLNTRVFSISPERRRAVCTGVYRIFEYLQRFQSSLYRPSFQNIAIYSVPWVWNNNIVALGAQVPIPFSSSAEVIITNGKYSDLYLPETKGRGGKEVKRFRCLPINLACDTICVTNTTRRIVLTELMNRKAYMWTGTWTNCQMLSGEKTGRLRWCFRFRSRNYPLLWTKIASGDRRIVYIYLSKR